MEERRKKQIEQELNMAGGQVLLSPTRPAPPYFEVAGERSLSLLGHFTTRAAERWSLDARAG